MISNNLNNNVEIERVPSAPFVFVSQKNIMCISRRVKFRSHEQINKLIIIGIFTFYYGDLTTMRKKLNHWSSNC